MVSYCYNWSKEIIFCHFRMNWLSYLYILHVTVYEREKCREIVFQTIGSFYLHLELNKYCKLKLWWSTGLKTLYFEKYWQHFIGKVSDYKKNDLHVDEPFQGIHANACVRVPSLSAVWPITSGFWCNLGNSYVYALQFWLECTRRFNILR